MLRRLFFISLVLGSLSVRAETLAIDFGDLPQLLETSSPQYMPRRERLMYGSSCWSIWRNNKRSYKSF